MAGYLCLDVYGLTPESALMLTDELSKTAIRCTVTQAQVPSHHKPS